MWLLPIAPDSERLPWYVQLSCSQVCLVLGSNLGSQMIFGSVCFSSLIGRNQCCPSLLNWMRTLESMTITRSLLLQSICVTEKNFFIDHLCTLLACVGLVNQYRNGPNEICASSLFIPFSFYSFILLSTCASFSMDSHPLPPAFFFFSCFSVVLSPNLLLDSSFCWSCLCFFSLLLDLTAYKISFSCSRLSSSEICFLSLAFLWSFIF